METRRVVEILKHRPKDDTQTQTQPQIHGHFVEKEEEVLHEITITIRGRRKLTQNGVASVLRAAIARRKGEGGGSDGGGGAIGMEEEEEEEEEREGEEEAEGRGGDVRYACGPVYIHRQMQDKKEKRKKKRK